jgi:diketogulonate reductase-like aldo/keto reductase
MVHWPVRMKPVVPFRPTDANDFLPLDWKVLWPAFEKLVEMGLTKSIGVSNMGVKKLQELIPHAKIMPAINQVCAFSTGYYGFASCLSKKFLC